MDQIPASELKPILVEAAKQGTGTKYAVVACFALLLYDNITTLADEVELIWKRKFTAVTFFFIMNRYYSVASLTIGVFENIIPAFTPTMCVFLVRSALLISRRAFISCKRIVLFQPLATAIPLTFFPNCIVGLRVYALYERNKLLAALMITYLVAEFGVALWVYLTPSMFFIQLPGPESVTNSLALHACLAYSSPRLNNFQAATFQFMQTIFDSGALLLVLYKSAKEFMGPKSNRGLRFIIASHGLAYYAVIFTANFSWAMMVIFATTGLKYSMAGITLSLAPLVANKLTLSLRSYTSHSTSTGPLSMETPAFARQYATRSSAKRRGSWMGTSTFELHTRPVTDSDAEFKQHDDSPPYA